MPIVAPLPALITELVAASVRPIVLVPPLVVSWIVSMCDELLLQRITLAVGTPPTVTVAPFSCSSGLPVPVVALLPISRSFDELENVIAPNCSRDLAPVILM